MLEIRKSSPAAQTDHVKIGQPQAQRIAATLARFGLAGIFLIALGLRLLYIFQSPQPPIVFDAVNHYLVGQMIQHDTINNEGWRIMALRGPVYPLFVATVFRLFGEDPWPLRCIQAGLGALTCLFVFQIGHQLVNRRVGLIAGTLAAISPALVLFTGRFMTETLALFLLWSGIALLIDALRTTLMTRMVLAGLAIGLACLARPTLLPLVPLLVLSIIVGTSHIDWRQRAGLLVSYGVVAFGIISIWSVFASTMTDARVTASSSGLRFVLDAAGRATHPAFKGWAPDSSTGFAANFSIVDPTWWRQALLPNPLGLVAAVLNLVFYHLWFAENAWREVFVISPNGMDWFQHGLFVLALAGLGLGLIRWRIFAPLLLMSVAYCSVFAHAVSVCRAIHRTSERVAYSDSQ
jgi:4-amino-4-deoxy-L-arabinose transferase-like glycosyltransferase